MDEETPRREDFDFRREVYPAKDGWRWRVRSTWNGLIVADGGQGYDNRPECVGTMERVTKEFPIVEVDE